MDKFKNHLRNGRRVQNIRLGDISHHDYNPDYPIWGEIYYEDEDKWEWAHWATNGDYFEHTDYSDDRDLLPINKLKTYKMKE